MMSKRYPINPYQLGFKKNPKLGSVPFVCDEWINDEYYEVLMEYPKEEFDL